MTTLKDFIVDAINTAFQEANEEADEPVTLSPQSVSLIADDTVEEFIRWCLK